MRRAFIIVAARSRRHPLYQPNPTQLPQVQRARPACYHGPPSLPPLKNTVTYSKRRSRRRRRTLHLFDAALICPVPHLDAVVSLSLFHPSTAKRCSFPSRHPVLVHQLLHLGQQLVHLKRLGNDAVLPSR